MDVLPKRGLAREGNFKPKDGHLFEGANRNLNGSDQSVHVSELIRINWRLVRLNVGAVQAREGVTGGLARILRRTQAVIICPRTTLS